MQNGMQAARKVMKEPVQISMMQDGLRDVQQRLVCDGLQPGWERGARSGVRWHKKSAGFPLEDQYNRRFGRRSCASGRCRNRLGCMEASATPPLSRSDAVYLEKRGNIAELILNRPAVLN